MIECANTDVQDLLPEFVAELLGANERLEVEVHLSGCPACRADVEVLRVVHQARPVPASINVAAIVAALPKPAVAAQAPKERAFRVITGEMPAAAPSMRTVGRTPSRSRSTTSRWFSASSMRMAAALTLVALGGLSVSIARRGQMAITESSVAVLSDAEFVVAQASTPYDEDVAPIVPHVPIAPSVLPIQELSDYSEDELSLLLDQLDAWDGAPSIDVIDPSAPSTVNDSLSEGGS
jgi:anti-sigma factor RsiW